MSTTSAVARPASIKLYYGQLNFWRAECIRIGLFVGGVPFEDIRDKQRPELNAAGMLPFGATPVLEVRALSLSSLTRAAFDRGTLMPCIPSITHRPAMPRFLRSTARC